MICEKCGNQVADNAKFCERCGNRVADLTTLPNSNPPKKKMIIIVAIVLVLAIAGTVIGISVSSCHKNKSLAELLTSHDWIREKKENSLSNNTYQESLSFSSDGTLIRIRSYSNSADHGKWSINGNILKINFDGSDDPLATYTMNYWTNITDREIDDGILGTNANSWYVSDKYFVYLNSSDTYDKPNVFSATDTSVNDYIKRNSSESITSRLTGHTWSQIGLRNNGYNYLKLMNDGTYSTEGSFYFDGEYHSENTSGTWKIENSTLIFDKVSYTYLYTFTDEDIESGTIPTATWKWYVSDKYLMISNGVTHTTYIV